MGESRDKVKEKRERRGKGNLRWSVRGVLRYAFLFLCISLLWWFFRSYFFFLMAILAMLAPVFSVWALLGRYEKLSVRVKLSGERLYEAQQAGRVNGERTDGMQQAGRGNGERTDGMQLSGEQTNEVQSSERQISRERALLMELWAENTNRFLPFYAELRYRAENLFTECAVEGTEQFWVGPGDSRIAERDLISRNLGRIEVQITSLHLYDYLHLVRIESDACRGAGVVVAGEAQEISGEDLSSCVEGFPEENELSKRGIDINPDYEVREYIPGDDLKSVHWKLTAKQGRTMVRERLTAGRDKVNVLLPLTGDEEENDRLMEALQGLCGLFLKKGYPVCLCRIGKGDVLISRYIAEPGELKNVVEEILSADGRKDPGLAGRRMAEQYPGEAYIAVRNGAYKGEYIR